jgi:16S rRNA (adenine1518-N6/adenine1519-N6)-dimethyltransferase
MRERATVRAFPPLRPHRALGQNFLRDPNISRNIIAAIAPEREDTLLEIGPGEGALTHELAARAGRLVIVDVDDRVIHRMREMLSGTAVEILHEDILNVDLAALAARVGNLRVVGNIPYNITTPILFHLLDHRSVIRDAVLMMQREVARRLSAVPGSKDYGILSVASQFSADVAMLFDVSPNVFYPRPNVTSTLVRLTMRATPRAAVADEAFFRSMVRAVFGKRRKTLRNSLRYFLGEPPPAGLEEFLEQRPEELAVEDLARLSNSLFEARRVERTPA